MLNATCYLLSSEDAGNVTRLKVVLENRADLKSAY